MNQQPNTTTPSQGSKGSSAIRLWAIFTSAGFLGLLGLGWTVLSQFPDTFAKYRNWFSASGAAVVHRPDLVDRHASHALTAGPQVRITRGNAAHQVPLRVVVDPWPVLDVKSAADRSTAESRVSQSIVSAFAASARPEAPFRLAMPAEVVGVLRLVGTEGDVHWGSADRIRPVTVNATLRVELRDAAGTTMHAMEFNATQHDDVSPKQTIMPVNRGIDAVLRMMSTGDGLGQIAYLGE